jgi:hypothetical protein
VTNLCRLSSVVCRLSSVVCRLSSVVCRLSSVVCRLSSVSASVVCLSVSVSLCLSLSLSVSLSAFTSLQSSLQQSIVNNHQARQTAQANMEMKLDILSRSLHEKLGAVLTAIPIAAIATAASHTAPGPVNHSSSPPSAPQAAALAAIEEPLSRKRKAMNHPPGPDPCITASPLLFQSQVPTLQPHLGGRSVTTIAVHGPQDATGPRRYNLRKRYRCNDMNDTADLDNLITSLRPAPLIHDNDRHNGTDDGADPISGTMPATKTAHVLSSSPSTCKQLIVDNESDDWLMADPLDPFQL